MLILTRRVGEAICISDDISVRVTEIQGGQVKLAIEAPREIPVHREEVYAVVREENMKAARVDAHTDPKRLWRRRGKT